MNTEAVGKLVAALRSGQYAQTRGQLRFAVDAAGSWAYCCLGVACDVYARETGRGHWVPYAFVAEGGRGAASLTMPQSVKEWYGFRTVNGGTGLSGEEETSLAFLNDKLKYNFNQIADYIETHPDLFVDSVPSGS